MDRKTQEQKYIILLKYVFIVIFVFDVLLADSLNTINLVLLLSYIIINQVRFFLLKKKNIYYYTSLIIEFIISCAIYKLAIGFKYLIFIPALIDIAIGLSSIISTIYLTGVIFICIIFRSNMNDIIINLICSLPILILGSIVRDEYGEKIRAQELYDKLREREEELKRVNKELENSVNTIEEITLLRERNRMSREIHDNVGHALSTIMIQLGAIENMALINGEATVGMARNLGKFTDESLQSIRAVVRSMKPREFEEYEGIVAISEMVKNFEKLSGIRVILKVSESFWRLSADQTMVIYRLIQEFLSNSIRHGKAAEVRIFLNFLPNNLRIHIKDDGIGCSNIKEGVGLKSIRERVNVWGGSLEYYSQEGAGFEIVANLERGKLGVGGV
ncbi:MAG: two-component sensor histidine kinase [Clostridiales bacterium]|jgi:signal transduction histidine kinase|nr:two-component sensor histidine kinase [Clostridiales bacterium]